MVDGAAISIAKIAKVMAAIQIAVEFCVCTFSPKRQIGIERRWEYRSRIGSIIIFHVALE